MDGEVGLSQPGSQSWVRGGDACEGCGRDELGLRRNEMGGALVAMGRAWQKYISGKSGVETYGCGLVNISSNFQGDPVVRIIRVARSF